MLCEQVADENDETPRFLAASYTGSVSEDVGVGHTVTTVNATDGDVGVNALIVYSIKTTNGSLDALPFAVHNLTGVITTTK